jgi:hypothetical protein
MILAIPLSEAFSEYSHVEMADTTCDNSALRYSGQPAAMLYPSRIYRLDEYDGIVNNWADWVT